MDLTAQAQSRIAWQYRNAEKFRALVSILPDIAQGEIEDVLENVAGVLDSDNASGPFLDILGRIVGQDRAYRTEVDNSTKQWGGSGIQFGAADSYFTATSETIERDSEDALYRILIKAKIARNIGDATIDGIVQAVNFFVSVQANIIDYENMTFDVVLRDQVPPADRFVLKAFDVVPRPQGVMFNGFIETKTMTMWGESSSMFRLFRGQEVLTAIDRSGNDNDGTLVNGPTWVSDGPNEHIRGALSFDGVDDYVEFSQESGSKTSITMECWARLDDPEDGEINVLMMLSNGFFSPAAVLTKHNFDRFRFFYGDNGSLETLTATFTPEAGVWYHVAGVASDSGAFLYVNGELEASDTEITSLEVGHHDTGWIGSHAGSQRFLNGDLSDARSWVGVARTQQQIQDNMNTRLTGDEAGLVGYHPLNDGLPTIEGRADQFGATYYGDL